MRRLFGRLMTGIMAPSLTQLRARSADDEHTDATEIETTINKIFLTSLQSEFETLKIFSLDAEKLAHEIASHLDIGLGRLNSSKFNDGEISIQILDSVRGQRVFIIKSFENRNINDGIMELLLAVSTMKKEGAESVTAIIPFFPYSLPSSSEQSHDDVTEGVDFFTCFGADLVKMLESLGCDEIITLNTAMTTPKGFAQGSKFLGIDATELVVPYLIYSGVKDPVIVGARSNKNHLRAVTQLWKTFGFFDFHCGMGFYNKDLYIGDEVKNRDVIIFSNILRSGNTLLQQSKDLKKKGARNIYCYGFHGLCTHERLEHLINELPIKELILTNSIQHTVEVTIAIFRTKRLEQCQLLSFWLRS